jgi:hypothetical protein
VAALACIRRPTAVDQPRELTASQTTSSGAAVRTNRVRPVAGWRIYWRTGRKQPANEAVLIGLEKPSHCAERAADAPARRSISFVLRGQSGEHLERVSRAGGGELTVHGPGGGRVYAPASTYPFVPWREPLTDRAASRPRRAGPPPACMHARHGRGPRSPWNPNTSYGDEAHESAHHDLPDLTPDAVVPGFGLAVTGADSR